MQSSKKSPKYDAKQAAKQPAIPTYKQPAATPVALPPVQSSKLPDMSQPSRIESDFNPTAGGRSFVRGTLDPANVFGKPSPKKVKGTIDPTTGTVSVGNYGKNNAALSGAFTDYLRTGDKGKLKDAGGAYKPLKKQIQALQATGWKYGTPSAGAPTVLPGQGALGWGQQPGNTPLAPTPPTFAPPGALPPSMQPPGGMQPPTFAPPGGMQPPPMQQAPVQSQRPAQLPPTPAYNPQLAQAEALRRPTGGGSRLVGGI